MSCETLGNWASPMFDYLEMPYYFRLNFVSLDDCIGYYDSIQSYKADDYRRLKQNCVSRYGVSNLPFYCDSDVNKCYYSSLPLGNFISLNWDLSYYDYLLVNNPFHGGNFYRSFLPCSRYSNTHDVLLCFGNFQRILTFCNLENNNYNRVLFRDKLYRRPDFMQSVRYYPFLGKFSLYHSYLNFDILDSEIDHFLEDNDLILYYIVNYDCESNTFLFNRDSNDDLFFLGNYLGVYEYKNCICNRLVSLNSLFDEVL